MNVCVCLVSIYSRVSVSFMHVFKYILGFRFVYAGRSAHVSVHTFVCACAYVRICMFKRTYIRGHLLAHK